MQHLLFYLINYYVLSIIIYGLLIILFVLSISIACITIYKKNTAVNKKLWQQHVSGVINEAILFEEEEEEYSEVITSRITMLLRSPVFKDYVINELIKIKKNLSGSSTSNLRSLYENLNLEKHSLKKITKLRWHIKAKGMHELGIMQQAKYLKEIFWHANNKNEMVRNESQCALVDFSGFSGLSFLDVTEYQVSQWQQVQLLNKLNGVKPDNFEAVKNWLRSTNESVVVFALKLAKFYNCYDVYESVIRCLESPSLQVKLSAVEYLKEMPREDTADHIIKQDYSDNKVCKLTVIHALKDIGNEKQIPFLLKKLHDKDDDIKAAAAKSLSILHPMGNAYLQEHIFADENPWKAIFLQITNERVA